MEHKDQEGLQKCTQEGLPEKPDYILSCNTIGESDVLMHGPLCVVLQSTCAAALMADLLTWPFCRCQPGAFTAVGICS